MAPPSPDGQRNCGYAIIMQIVAATNRQGAEDYRIVGRW